MAPGAKRKRGDRTYSQDSSDGSGRPSPHRPGDLNLAQHSQHQAYQSARGRGRGGNRGGGRIGSHQSDSPRPGPNGQQTRASPTNIHQMPPPVAHQYNSPQSRDAQAPTPAPVQKAAAPSTKTSDPGPQTLVPKEAPPPYYYEFLTDEYVSSWQDLGRNAVIAVAGQAREENNSTRLSIVFQEMLRSGIDGRVEPSAIGQAIGEIVANPTSVDASSLFLDTLSILSDNDTSNPFLRDITTATGISAALMREQLEEPLLRALGLIRPTFGKMFIRKQTNLLYKQSNYNLLREESEGYSKLVTELFTTTNNEPPSGEVVEATFENIKALIGAFDLDAGRVLDVTLDIFASLLVKHYRFFVKFLRTSSWWPQESSGDQLEHQDLGGLPIWAQPDHSSWMASEDEKLTVAALKEVRDHRFWARAREVGMDAFFELSGRRSAKATDDINAANASETEKWINATGLEPPLGNSVAAQLLGFKLRFYASEARDAHDVLPVNLIYLSALLIKIGFISLKDLYSHLYPTDEEMEVVKEKQLKEKEERERLKRPGGGQANALMMAGALADDTLPLPAVTRLREAPTRSGSPSRSDNAGSKAATPPPPPPSKIDVEEEKETLPEPDDQKVQLLRSLLCIGAIPEALYLLGRHPWLPDAFSDLPEHIHRILHHCLSKVYDPLCPLKTRHSVRSAARTTAHDQTGLPKGEIRLTDPPATRVLRWAQLDRNDTNEGIDYRFYWDDWSDHVPICQSVDDVFTLCSTFLNYSGVKIGQDPALLMKLARIGKHSLSQDSSEANSSRWFDLLKRLLVPALSLTKANPGVVNEVYDLLRFFPTQARYNIYAEWYTGQISRLPDIKAAFDLAKRETKDTLRRISKINTKPMARNIAKIACASPGVVFGSLLSQLEAYDNFVEVVVDCGRYFTYMGYDVLAWSIMSALGRAGRDRVSTDGISTSQWLVALSRFVGKVYKRYSHLNPFPILQYILEQARQSNFTDLRVLREMIESMAGIAPDTNFTEGQVQAMAGGELLQAQTLVQLMDKRHESKAAARRLLRSITEGGLTGQLLISIAQERQMCIFNKKQKSLKVIGENFDDIHIVMSQYLDMLRYNLSPKDFDLLIPSMIALVTDFGLEPSIVFTIYRVSISRAVAEYDAEGKEEKKESNHALNNPVVETNGDIEMGEATETSTGKETDDATLEDAKDSPSDGEMAEAPPGADQIKSSPNATGLDSPSPWNPVLQLLMEEMKPALRQDFEQSMSLPFFVTFWQLSLHDMLAPSGSYNEEIERQKARIQVINSDRTDISSTGVKRKEAEKKTINELLDRLREEMKAHIHSYQHVRARLSKEKDHWFTPYAGNFNALNASILQECFLPRLQMSPLDSFFTFRMLFYLHSSGAQGFNTMHLIDRLLNEKSLTSLIYQFTARECDNFGRFIHELLKELSAWHSSRSTYERRAWGQKKELPGFARSQKEGKPDRFLDYEDFRRLFYKWHRNLHHALKASLNNGEYMHIKNAITVLKCIQRHFPIVDWTGKGICTVLEGIIQAEKKEREDIWVAASSLYGSLKSREKNWVIPQAFYITDSSSDPHRAPSRATSVQPKARPQNDEVPKLLNAAAAEFLPRVVASKTENEPPLSARSEFEDGEVKDFPMAETKAEPNASNSAGKTNERSSEGSTTALAQDSAAQTVRPTASPSPVPVDKASQVNGSQTVPRDNSDSDSKTRIPAALPPKTDTEKSASTHVQSSRAPHNLPSKPDVQPLSRRYPERVERAERPFPRDRANPEHGRLDRPADLIPQRMHDSHTHSPGRLEVSATERHRDGTRMDSRDARGYLDPRQGRSDGRDLRPPPRVDLDQRMAEYPSRPDPRDTTTLAEEFSARQSQPPAISSSISSRSEGHPINPARATLIGQAPDRISRPSPQAHRSVDDPPRPASDDENARRSSRLEENGLRSNRSSQPASPRRRDGRQPYPSRDEYRIEDRTGYERRQLGEDSREIPLQRLDQRMEQAPSGPRVGRTTRHLMTNDTSRPSDLMQPPSFSRVPPDQSHGRLGQDFPRSPRLQDSNYGRLNNEPISPTSRSRNFVKDPVNQDPPTTAEVGGPTTRTKSRDEGGSKPAEPVATSSTSAPTTPVAEKTSPELTGIHPSRLSNIPQDPHNPPPLQTGHLNSIPPSGPRSATLPTTGSTLPSPTNRNPPTGPAANHSDRRRDTRQFAGIQAQLQQSGQSTTSAPSPPGDRGTSIRGRASVGRPQESPTSMEAPTSFPASNNNGPSSQYPRLERGGDYRRQGASSFAPSQPPPSQREPPRRDESYLRGPQQDIVSNDRDRERDREERFRPSRNGSPARAEGRSTRSTTLRGDGDYPDKSFRVGEREPSRRHASDRSSELRSSELRGSDPRDRERERDRDRDREQGRERGDRSHRDDYARPHDDYASSGPRRYGIGPGSGPLASNGGSTGDGMRPRGGGGPPRGGGDDRRDISGAGRKRAWPQQQPEMGESKRPRRRGAS